MSKSGISPFFLAAVIFLTGFVAAPVLAQQADIEVEFRPSAPVLQAGLPQEWIAVVRNLGPLPTEEVILTFEMLGPLEVHAVDPAELCEVREVPDGLEWVCSLGSLAAGDSTVVTWSVEAREEGSAVDLNWIATHAQEDPDPKNDRGTLTIPTAAPFAVDLQVLGFVGNPVLARGLDLGSHRLEVRNAGPDPAYAVVLTETLPAGWVPTEIQTEGFAAVVDSGGSVVTITIDSLAPGQNGTAFITFAPTTEGWHELSARIEGYGEDIDPGNDAAVDSVLVLPTPDYVVNTTDDVDDGVCDDVHCSLREALRAAGRIGPLGGGTVAFRIPGPAPHVIQPVTAYTNIQNDMVLDGWYQTGFAGVPLVEIDGSAVPGSPSGLAFFSGAEGAVVRGLAIGGFGYRGLTFATDSLTVEGCYVGLRADGSTALPNSTGIGGGMNGSRIGGPSPWQRNVISGNSSYGIHVIGTAFGGTITGNHVGTDAAGAVAVPNSGGIFISGGGGLTIGGPDPADGNLVSGNGFPGGFGKFGIRATDTVEQTIRIHNNRIGCDVTGEAALPNLGPGVDLTGSGPAYGTPFYQVGDAGAGNVVSGNGDIGISVGSPTTRILGNFIGVTASGNASLPNGHWGLRCGAGFVRIGRPGAGNLIGPNSGVALVMNSGADACTLQANLIGANAAGTDLGGGLTQLIGADDLLVGGPGPGEGNVFWNIQANGTGQVFQGNMIGVKGDGATPFAAPPGIAFSLSGSDILVGGSGPGEGNVIGGATGNGLSLSGGPAIVVQGNNIGVGSDGTTPLPNDRGLVIGSLFQSIIGGPGAGNRIAFNNSTGIHASGGGYSEVEIVENDIHDNGGDGVWLDVADEGLYGGPYGQIGIHRNAIRHNAGLGIDIGNNGVDYADPLDGDNGDNGQQNTVSIVQAEARGDSLDVVAQLTSHPEADFLVEFFLNSSCDPTGVGEGELFLGSVDIRTYPSGDGFVTAAFPYPDQSRFYLTATVTDSLDQTSEFSNCQAIAGVAGVEDLPPAPLVEGLLGAFPNPFNPRTVLRWGQTAAAGVELLLYDLAGRRVASLSPGRLPAGRHEIPWTATDDAGRSLPSGVYLVRLKLDGRQAGATRKIMLLR